MVRTVWWLALSVAALVLVGNVQVKADTIVVAPPVVSYYAPTPAPAPCSSPAVVAVPAPLVTYYAAPAVSYYYTPSVSYYTAPAPAPVVPGAAVTTTRYGLLGRPRSTTTYYYPPVAVGP